MNYSDKYEPVIGLEVHAQMKTKSKAFCSCSTEYNAPPNTNVCPVCLGHPGTLPVLNKNLVEYILRLGLSTNCKINEKSIFARKNYFYADLPKGYQISQYDKPICHDGWVEIEINGRTKKIGITRIHMEEDAGKSIHDFSSTLVDLNRCGIPLIEIVSEPDISSTDEAYLYLLKLKQLVQYLGICDANMEEGSLRCDANVSVRLKGEKKFGTKTEVKNLNSFKNAVDALDSEIIRQIKIIEKGENVVHQTLTYDAKTKKTYSMRSKEEVHDYRYFPEPDLVKVYVDEDWKKRIKSEIPELPEEKIQRFINDYSLSLYESKILTESKEMAEQYESTASKLGDKSPNGYRTLAKIMINNVRKELNERKISIYQLPIKKENLAALSDATSGGLLHISVSTPKVFNEMLKYSLTSEEQNPLLIIEKLNLKLSDDKIEIEKIVKKIIDDNPKEVERYKNGETKLLGFFVGKIMKESKGKANPKRVNELLEKNLK